MIKYPEKFRVLGESTDDGGMFAIPFEGRIFKVIASHGGDWNHVSVSLENRCPNWREMCFIKVLFFGEDDLVIQYHPPKSKYKNVHPYCLHLWQPQDVEIPMPPMEFV